MLDTSYGFNSLLKEVKLASFRVTSISPDSKRLCLKTSMLAKKSPPRSNDHSVHLVI